MQHRDLEGKDLLKSESAAASATAAHEWHAAVIQFKAVLVQDQIVIMAHHGDQVPF